MSASSNALPETAVPSETAAGTEARETDARWGPSVAPVGRQWMVNVLQLVFRRPLMTLSVAVMSLGAILSSPLLGLGFIAFGFVATIQLGDHFHRTFGEKPRPTAWAGFVATGLSIFSILVFVGWTVFAREYHMGIFEFPMTSMGVARTAMILLPIPYALFAWVVGPLLVSAVLALDPKGPHNGGWRGVGHLLALSVRVTAEIPMRIRIAGVTCTGALLMSPVVWAALDGDPFAGMSTYWIIGALMLFLPMASAFLITGYAAARSVLGRYQVSVGRFPGSLVALGILALTVTCVVLSEGVSLVTTLALALAWLATLVAIRVALRRLVLRYYEDGASGRCALEGRIEHAGRRFRAPGVEFEVPANFPVTISTKATEVTLVGNFAPRRGGFRESALQSWPADAELLEGTVAAILAQRAGKAYGLLHLPLVAITLSGLVLL